jgi:hypothetical protein
VNAKPPGVELFCDDSEGDGDVHGDRLRGRALMAGKTLRRLIPVLFLLLVVGGLTWWAQSSRPPAEYPMAYVVQSSAIVWNSNAQVRQPVTTLHYGDHVTILQRSGERAEVRSDAGAQGWIDEPALMDADLWQQAAALLDRVKQMPVQARGHTRTISNVRLTAGRDGPRIFQFGRNEPVVVLERGTSPVPAEGPASAGEVLPKREDWLLVLRTPADETGAAQPAASAGAGLAASQGATGARTPAVPIAGWVLGRFIELDPPAPIPDYFTASGVRVVAWMELNRVLDEGEPRPQYLVAGARGGEGQPCDFTLLRVYTWGLTRHRYETAYIENDVCGRMPIRVTAGAAGEEFRFADPLQDGADRVYRVRQTTVRRVTSTAAPSRGQR